VKANRELLGIIGGMIATAIGAVGLIREAPVAGVLSGILFVVFVGLLVYELAFNRKARS
jgi:hypothetical protein